MANTGKQYGLLVPKKSGQNLQPRPSIFGDDSDSDSGDGSNWVGKSFKNESIQKRQTKLDIKRALEQDPTVYQYDEVYDAMEEKKMEQKNKRKDPEKKPKYIQALLATAERRKREEERRTERKVQREREEEGEEFKDKEAFVTPAYRQKLEEFQAMDEQERMQDRIEELTDVAKQKDLGGFYRHLYHQTVGDNDTSLPLTKVKEEKETENIPEEEELGNGGQEEQLDLQEAGEPKGLNKVEERSYRKRKVSSSSEDSDEEKGAVDKKSKPGKGSNGDSDSSSSGSSSESSSENSGSSSEDEGNERKGDKDGSGITVKKEASEPEGIDETNRKQSVPSAEKVNGVIDEKIGDKDNSVSGDEVAKEKPPEEPKPNIWEKKTVGPVFEAALQRYLTRKAARLVNGSM